MVSRISAYLFAFLLMGFASEQAHAAERTIDYKNPNARDKFIGTPKRYRFESNFPDGSLKLVSFRVTTECDADCSVLVKNIPLGPISQVFIQPVSSNNDTFATTVVGFSTNSIEFTYRRVDGGDPAAPVIFDIMALGTFTR